MIKNQWNQRYHPWPSPCKNSAERAQKQKNVASLLRKINQVMDGKLSIHALRTDSHADKKLIRATFKKAGFIY